MAAAANAASIAKPKSFKCRERRCWLLSVTVTFACSVPALSHIHPRKWINISVHHLPFSFWRNSSVKHMNLSEEEESTNQQMFSYFFMQQLQKLLSAPVGCNEKRKTPRGI